MTFPSLYSSQRYCLYKVFGRENYRYDIRKARNTTVVVISLTVMNGAYLVSIRRETKCSNATPGGVFSKRGHSKTLEMDKSSRVSRTTPKKFGTACFKILEWEMDKTGCTRVFRRQTQACMGVSRAGRLCYMGSTSGNFFFCFARRVWRF
ncbi:unnamed protein product [Ascophyllum nodosum]